MKKIIVIALCFLFISGCSVVSKNKDNKKVDTKKEVLNEVDKELIRAGNCNKMKAALTLEIQNDFRFNQSNEDLIDALKDTKRVYDLCISSNEPYYYEVYKEIFYDPYLRIDYLRQIEEEVAEIEEEATKEEE